MTVLNKRMTSRIVKPKKVDKAKTKLRRHKFTDHQKTVLENHYQESAVWSKQKIKQLGDELGLTSSKVYKWNWDRKHKDYVAGLQD